MRSTLTVTLILVSVFAVTAQEGKINAGKAINPAMDKFVTELMSKMTLEEKIGQLNLVSVGFDVTGPIVSKDVDAKIQKGLVGGVFNTFTPVAVRKLQQMAIEKSRLKIP